MVGVRKTRRLKKVSSDHYRPGPCQCRPRVGKKRPAHGCLAASELQKIASKVLGSQTLLRTQVGGVSAVALRKELEKQVGVGPNQEYSFVQALPIDEAEKQRLQIAYLRPPQPEVWRTDPDKWLDSTNIENVMKQYEEDVADFKFLGPYPIDFAAPDPYNKTKTKCLISEMCSLDMAGLKAAGKSKVGIIYNLDPHNKGGSHWVGNYVDLKKKVCYYFDSYGMEVPGQIEKFMQWLTLQDPAMKLAYNARRFQLKDSECGMYSMYFIIRMLMGEEFRPFCRRAPRDGEMLALRSWLFST